MLSMGLSSVRVASCTAETHSIAFYVHRCPPRRNATVQECNQGTAHKLTLQTWGNLLLLVYETGSRIRNNVYPPMYDWSTYLLSLQSGAGLSIVPYAAGVVRLLNDSLCGWHT
jgi:hypothetical protein